MGILIALNGTIAVKIGIISLSSNLSVGNFEIL
jgi:hypothetical protein